MARPIQFPGEDRSNQLRQVIARHEPPGLRTFTPSQAVLARSSGVFHWTPEGRRLYDFTSGVLVANLGHNPRRWTQRFVRYMNWPADSLAGENTEDGFFDAVPMTAYNAITEVEAQAVQRLVRSLQGRRGGARLESVLWAASGAEAVQKALWACLQFRPERDIILATRYGFHGKKGLAGAVTGSEKDPDRDPRVRFIAFPMEEVDDVSLYGQPFDPRPYEEELERLKAELGGRLNCLITEPYLGGGGSYHPPSEYLKLLERFCRENDVLLILDEIQSNLGRTGFLYAFEKHGIEPDIVTLGKGLGNGVPVAAAVGRADVLASLDYGEGSDTFSANPLACAAVLATLDEFESTDILEHTRRVSKIFFDGLSRLKELPVVAKVRGEGMVFGVEAAPVGELSANEVANRIVEACYLGDESGNGIHLMGPLAGKVLRVSPPMVITEEQSRESLELMYRLLQRLSERLAGGSA